jgi:YHS domain-containing protein
MKKIVLMFVFVAGIIVSVSAQKSEVFVKEDAAIRGYDPVAYFTSGKPVKGNKQFLVIYKEATWYFSSKQNADLFKSSPEKYMPQYGGYCAYGLADGHKAPTDPDAWTIAEGKLYLNYDKDVKQLWLKKQKEYIITANKNWPAIKNKE